MPSAIPVIAAAIVSLYGPDGLHPDPAFIAEMGQRRAAETPPAN